MVFVFGRFKVFFDIRFFIFKNKKFRDLNKFESINTLESNRIQGRIDMGMLWLPAKTDHALIM